jgi:hypothetical protein
MLCARRERPASTNLFRRASDSLGEALAAVVQVAHWFLSRVLPRQSACTRSASAKWSGSDHVVRALFASHGFARAYGRMVAKTSMLAACKTLANTRQNAIDARARLPREQYRRVASLLRLITETVENSRRRARRWFFTTLPFLTNSSGSTSRRWRRRKTSLFIAINLWQINDPDAPLHLPLRAPHHKNAFVAAAEAMAAAAPAPSPRPTTSTTRAKGMTYFQRLAAEAEAARQARLERLKAEAKAAEEAGALGLKSEAD